MTPLVDCALSELVEGPQRVGDVVLVRRGEAVEALLARCRHMDGRMSLSADGTELVCPRHGWCIPLSAPHLEGSFAYAHPHGMKHPALRVVHDGERLRVFDDGPVAPWGQPEPRRPLETCELSLSFLAHACLELRAGPHRVITDPWLMGPAFSRGWWLAHRPPEDAMERLVAADLIYVSHNHSDHLNPWTLEVLAKRKPEARFVVPAFESGSCARELAQLGFESVTRLDFGTWLHLGELRLMILRDRTDRDDSAVLFEYAGRRILDTVDCHNLGPLPEVDVLLAQHTRGASGYPVCWEAQYGATEIARRIDKDLRRAETGMAALAERTRARMFVPFAGWFTEAHPADADIAASNRKNDAHTICEKVRHRTGARTWIPGAGGMLDVDRLEVLEPGDTSTPGPDAATLETFVRRIAEDAAEPALDTLDGMQRYFDWAEFRSDIILHLLETDERYAEVLRELHVDFRDGRVLAGPPPSTDDVRQLRMSVRRDAFRHVLARGKSWEELSIGFQARFFRSPDVYAFDFWDHFQHRLPDAPPEWEGRIERAAG